MTVVPTHHSLSFFQQVAQVLPKEMPLSVCFRESPQLDQCVYGSVCGGGRGRERGRWRDGKHLQKEDNPGMAWVCVPSWQSSGYSRKQRHSVDIKGFLFKTSPRSIAP